MQVLGWSICSLIPKFTFASREKTYTVNESKQMWRTHALLDMWIGMLELAIEEQMPAFCRVSAVKSIHMSKMLSWSVEYGIAVLCAHNGAKSTKQVNSLISGAVHNGEFACRLWLVVLQLMQVCMRNHSFEIYFPHFLILNFFLRMMMLTFAWR